MFFFVYPPLALELCLRFPIRIIITGSVAKAKINHESIVSIVNYEITTTSATNNKLIEQQ